MAKVYYNRDVQPKVIRQRKVAVLGFGSQGHAHALNLKESGVPVRVGLRPGSRSWEKAQSQGLDVVTIPEAVQWADLIAVLIPDTAQPQVFQHPLRHHHAA